jgi:GTPase
MTARIAIIGRPNVGKSTLFNRLVGRKVALVDDQPGVTRDRREGIGRIADLTFTLYDTAGLEDAKKGTLEDRMSARAEEAIALADLVLFVIDARVGVTPTDKAYAQRVRKSGKPVALVANKCESKASLSGLGEAYQLGLGEPLAVSAEHGEGLEYLYEAIAPFCEKAAEVEEERDLGSEEDEEYVPTKPLKLAIIGQPNAGKSTLVNAMLGEERMLTGPEPGITRDAISSRWMYKDREIQLWDTAGIRRKSRVTTKIEKLSVSDALHAVRFAEVVVVLIDATMEIERQDLSLADLVSREGRAVVLALSKWDAVEDKNRTMKSVESDLEDILPDIRDVPVVTVSGKQGRGVDQLMKTVFEQEKRWNQRVSTGRFNRFLEAVVQKNPPPAPSGRRIKIRYGTQVSARPPTFALFGNQLSKLPETYIRYLMNNARTVFKLNGVPIRFLMRGGKNPYEK